MCPSNSWCIYFRQEQPWVGCGYSWRPGRAEEEPCQDEEGQDEGSWRYWYQWAWLGKSWTP